MIIMISETKGDRREVSIGDTFDLTHSLEIVKNDEHVDTIHTKIISSEIIKNTYIDYYCIYVFAEEDGTVTGENMCGMFGKQNAIPKEIQEAVHVDDLTSEQRIRFNHTCPIRSDVYAELG